jgi:hypothetical protein
MFFDFQYLPLTVFDIGKGDLGSEKESLPIGDMEQISILFAQHFGDMPALLPGKGELSRALVQSGMIEIIHSTG